MTHDPWAAKPATRKQVPLITGLEGPPGGGKTASALLLAQGMQEVRGGPIILIDTENRATKYAGVTIGNGRPFAFEVVDFEPPFRASRYLEAIRAQLPRNPAAIIVDTMSDEHEGEGGRLEWHEEELDNLLRRYRIPPDDYGARDRHSQSAWKPSSAARVRLVNGLLRIKTPLILTFRAREKTRPVEQEKQGRNGQTRTVTVPTNIGYQPIAPAEIVHAIDIMCLLPARADGVPLWRSDKSHQDFILKLPEQFRGLFTEGRPITPEIGRALATWAMGDDAPLAAEKTAPAQDGQKPEEASVNFSPEKRKLLHNRAREKMRAGRPIFDAWVAQLNELQCRVVGEIWDELQDIGEDAALQASADQRELDMAEA